MIGISKKWLKFGLVATLILLALEQSVYAEEIGSEEKTLKEVGVSLVMPALLNVNFGLWGTSELPLVARVSGMYWGNSAYGAQAEFGYLLSRSETFKCGSQH